MKIESKAKVFQPVTITIETEDELRTLWHALNVNPKDWGNFDSVPSPNYLLSIDMFEVVDSEVIKQGLKNE